MTVNPLDDNTDYWAAWPNAFANALEAEGIVSGCSISKGAGDWDIDVTSGTVIANGTEASVSSGSVTITDSSGLTSGQSRVTLITANSSGTISSTDGSAASNPTTPDIPSDEALLGFVVVHDTDSTAADSDIYDIPALIGGVTALSGTLSGISENTWKQNTTGTTLYVGARIVAGGTDSTGTGNLHHNSSQSNRTVATADVANAAGFEGEAWLSGLVPRGHYYKVVTTTEASIGLTIEQEVYL